MVQKRNRNHKLSPEDLLCQEVSTSPKTKNGLYTWLVLILSLSRANEVSVLALSNFMSLMWWLVKNFIYYFLNCHTSPYFASLLMFGIQNFCLIQELCYLIMESGDCMLKTLLKYGALYWIEFKDGLFTWLKFMLGLDKAMRVDTFENAYDEAHFVFLVSLLIVSMLMLSLMLIFFLWSP